MFTAIVRVSGAGRLADFRERLRSLMVRDPEAEDYTEHHAGGLLEYRFTPKKGIPFPALAEASGDFPELRVEAQWDHDGVSGRAVIENGRVVDEHTSEQRDEGVYAEIAEDGRLVLALVCEQRDGQWLGYAASAERHTYFRYGERELQVISPEDADTALEEIAFRLADQWLWYDEEEQPTERSRYAQYGYPVRGANIRSEKLALLRRRNGPYSTLADEANALREALVAQWLTAS